MAGANLSDDVALASAIGGGLFRILATSGLLGRIDPLSVPSAAAAAGISEEQARQFFAGELVLPPHQRNVFVDAMLERQRLMTVAQAKSRVPANVPVPSETTAEGAEAAVRQLERDFKSWRFALPDGVRDLGTDRPAKLIWRASLAGSQVKLAGVSAAELRGLVELHEASRAVEAKRFKAYAEG